MLPWLAAVCVFTTLSALYLGGFPLRIEGGGARQLLGWLLSGVLFLAVWRLILVATSAVAGEAGAVVLALAPSILLLPVLTWAAFRPLGVRISRAKAGH